MKRAVADTSEFWRLQLDASEDSHTRTKHAALRDRAEWAQVLQKLTHYSDGDEVYQLHSATGEDPLTYRPLTIHNSMDHDALIFRFLVTKFLIHRSKQVLDERELRFIVKLIEGQVTKYLMEAFIGEAIQESARSPR